MNLIRISLVVSLLLLTPALTMAAPASEASIKQLMEITEMRKLIDSLPAQIKSQMETAMNNAIQQHLQGKSLKPAQQRAVDNMTKRMTDLLAGELSYDKMESKFIPAYRETFTEEEVAGMIAFYKTPTGQAVIHKMPVLMQKTMSMQQESVMQLMPKLQEIQQQFAAEMQEASK